MINYISTLVRKFLRNNPYHPKRTVIDYIDSIRIIKERCPDLQFAGVWPMVEPFDKNRKYIDRLRKSGQTTRIIDECVQTLFNTGRVKIVDHYNSEEANKYIYNKFMKRLDREHPMIAGFCKSEKSDGAFIVSLLVRRGEENGGMNKVNIARLK